MTQEYNNWGGGGVIIPSPQTRRRGVAQRRGAGITLQGFPSTLRVGSCDTISPKLDQQEAQRIRGSGNLKDTRFPVLDQSGRGGGGWGQSYQRCKQTTRCIYAIFLINSSTLILSLFFKKRTKNKYIYIPQNYHIKLFQKHTSVRNKTQTTRKDGGRAAAIVGFHFFFGGEACLVSIMEVPRLLV